MIPAAIDPRSLLADVPHDASAIFLYALLLACLVLVWRANRGSGSPGAGDPASDDPKREESP